MPLFSKKSCIWNRSNPICYIFIRYASFFLLKKSPLSWGFCPPIDLAYDSCYCRALFCASVAGFGRILLYLKKFSIWPGTSSRVSFASCIGLWAKSLNGTNCTISAAIYFLYFCEYSGTSSASNSSIALKSAWPTPTIIIDRGRDEPYTTSSIVFCKSLIIPSVMIRRIEYF